MSMRPPLDDLRRLLYRCQNRELLRQLEEWERRPHPEEDRFAMQLIKAQALFELHEVTAARQVLQSLCASQNRHTGGFLYVLAKVSYFCDEFDKAERMFRLLKDESETVRDFFRAALGLANVLQGLERYAECSSVIGEMREVVELVPQEDQICFELLAARQEYLAFGRVDEADKLLHRVIKRAQSRQETYFVLKALYFLAEADKIAGRKEAFRAHLALLECYLSPEETVHLNYIVNERFKDDDFSVEVPIQFDFSNKRVAVSGRWLPLHDKPLVFNFIKILYQAGRFVSKKELSEELWTNEDYKPRLHDPRIFDLARRVRGLIEPCADQPLCLLSGRLGFKLVTQKPEGVLEARQAVNA